MLPRTGVRHRDKGEMKVDALLLAHSIGGHLYSCAHQSTFQQSRDSGWHRPAGVGASWPLRENLVPLRCIACLVPIVPTALLF